MGTGKNTTSEEMRIIWKMHENGKKVAEISEVKEIFRRNVHNAIKSSIEKSDVLIKGKSRKPMPRNIDVRTDKLLSE